MRLLRNPLVLAGLAILALLAIGEAVAPGFAGAGQLRSQFVIAAMLGVIAAGQNLVILAGREGIDLSVGAMLGLGALVAGNVMNGDNAMILAGLGAAVAVTGAFGLLNGLGITILRIPPLVMTLGMAGVIQGLLIILTSGRPSGRAAPALTRFIIDPLVVGIPGLVFVWAGLALLLIWFLRRSRAGLNIYAIGTNQEAARLSGVPVTATRILVFALSGAFSGITGFLILGYTQSVFIGVGNAYVLPSIIAVVIGGTPLSGGTGGYTGTIAGAILLTLLQSLLNAMAIEPFGRQIIFGVVLIGLMLIYGRQDRLRT
ncbi:MAG TPA: ABC transporter permease [Amaricoccus sp.]|uniref:ABC transporter permease n=1 Tax=Amaricoccus sp. TaxID=1872485 RepID=UPI002B5F7E61|nr:ABC transporter permease [Amaricoccus sp.]HMQ94120.1 ABC transporter permease [Amaricoccus sp.]HMR53004.1 ABC transporter permease [Amaricoccus sp.]HMR59129.1 ABC transporter permease [Amaricoccus sp.]HMT99942.1 ABC transporter permease [Amaricoccus sp.]